MLTDVCVCAETKQTIGFSFVVVNKVFLVFRNANSTNYCSKTVGKVVVRDNLQRK